MCIRDRSVTELLQGAIIPLPFFPDAVRQILELLPFAAMQNVPLRVYSGDLSGAALEQAILLSSSGLSSWYWQARFWNSEQ